MSALLVRDASPHLDPRRAKVLVAEDHEDTRLLLRALLEKRGHSVIEAGNGLEAVTVAERERPDLILMDGALPLLDGIEATRRLRSLPSISAVPIVFLSGHAGPQAQSAALEAGCDDYVVKPFELARLDAVLNQFLREGGGRQHAEGLVGNMTQSMIKEDILGEMPRPGREAAPTRKLFGLVELDSAGTVLYTRFEADGAAPAGAAPDHRGRNFYTEVAPFGNVVEFRERVDSFSRGSQPAHSMDFTCEYADGPVLVRVLLARIRERSQADTTKSVLVHIRRAQ